MNIFIVTFQADVGMDRLIWIVRADTRAGAIDRVCKINKHYRDVVTVREFTGDIELISDTFQGFGR